MNQSIGDIVIIGGACLFASWTLVCFVMIFCGFSFSELMAWSIAPLVLGLLLTKLCIDKDFPATKKTAQSKSRPVPAGYGEANLGYYLFILTIAAIALRISNSPYWLVWLALTAVAGVVFHLAHIPNQPPPSHESKTLRRLGISALIICGAVLAATTHRPDYDDAQYLNFIVTALDFPTEPLFSRSGLWQDPSVPLELPIYRLHTYELLIAALSHITGVEYKIFYYLILPSIFGAAAMLVHWRLAQYLVPQHALLFLLSWLILIIALGESHKVFGNFAFVRIFQGKAILVTVFLPLCFYMGLRFSEVPNRARALALALTCIASTGFTSSGIVTVPIVLAATLLGGLTGASKKHSQRILYGGLFFSGSIIAIGAFLFRKMEVDSSAHEQDILGTNMGLSLVLGDSILGAIVLAVFPLAPLFVSDDRRRCIFALTTFVYVVAMLNPWLTPLIAKTFDPALQWRLFWSVPLVISAAISLTGVAGLLPDKLSKYPRQGFLMLLLIGTLLLSNQLSISPKNNVVLELPRYKIEPTEYALAEEIVKTAPSRSTIYAPISIAHWITTFRQHPFPLVVRHEYVSLKPIINYFGYAEIMRRKQVIRVLHGVDVSTTKLNFFWKQLENDEPSTVVYKQDIDTAGAISEGLQARSYVGEKRGEYWVWFAPAKVEVTNGSTR